MSGLRELGQHGEIGKAIASAGSGYLLLMLRNGPTLALSLTNKS